MSNFLKLALRNLVRHRALSAAALAAVAFGVVALILTGGFIEDTIVEVGESLIHSQTGHLQVARSGFFEGGSRAPEKYVIDPADAVRAASGLPETKDVMVRLGFGGLASNGRAELPVIGEGVEPDKERQLGSYLGIRAGRQLTDTDTFGILVGDGLARALAVGPGDRLSLLVNAAGGSVNTLDFTVVGIFQTFQKEFDARAVRLPLSAAQELIATRGVTSIVVALRETGQTDAAAATLRSRLQGGDFEVRTWIELNDFYTSTAALYGRVFGFFQFVILVMVILSVANSMTMSVFERIAEFGTMRALGTTSRGILWLVVTEGALLGLIGAGIGVALGIALALGISAVGIPMPPPPNADLGYDAMIRVSLPIVLSASAIGIAATIGAAFFPGRRASALPIVDALRERV